MKNTPYTVLMSVYIKEKAEYLKLSIQSMLDQTVPPDEFILVKDGPLTTELDAVVDYYNQKYPGLFTIISNETNLGLGPALAKGIVTSRNELIARMDSDDISEKTRCEKQLLAFEKDTDLEMVGSFEAEFIGEKDNVVSIHRVPETHSDIAKFMRRRCAILHPTVMYKKSAVIRSGNYHSVPLYEDYDLFARMVLEYNVRSYNIQENLYYIRTSEDAYKVGRFLGWYYNALRERNGNNEPARIVIGKDTRRSSYMFEYSLVAGLTASGADACLLHIYIGV